MYAIEQEVGVGGASTGGGGVCIDTFYLISGSSAKLKCSITSNVILAQ